MLLAGASPVAATPAGHVGRADFVKAMKSLPLMLSHVSEGASAADLGALYDHLRLLNGQAAEAAADAVDAKAAEKAAKDGKPPPPPSERREAARAADGTMLLNYDTLLLPGVAPAAGMRAELAATHKALRRVFESEEARWRVAVRRADDPAREAAEGGVFAALFPPCFPDLGAHVDGGGGHTVLKYGTLSERDSLAHKLVSAVQRDVNALGSAARAGAPKLTLEAAAAKLAARDARARDAPPRRAKASAISTPTPSPARARSVGDAPPSRRTRRRRRRSSKVLRAVGRLRPARRVLDARCRTRDDVCDAASAGAARRAHRR